MSKILIPLLLGLLPGWAFAEELIHTTATLSEPRSSLAATSVGNLAMFAGGYGDSGYSDVVDIYDAETGTWSTAVLSEARVLPAATTVGSLAMFAGGDFGPLGWLDGLDAEANLESVRTLVDIFDADTGTWSTANLSQPDVSAAVTVGTKAMFAAEGSDVVDVFDAQTGLWSTATLSQPRSSTIAATAVGGKALFAGPLDNGSVVVDIYDLQADLWSTGIIPGAKTLDPLALTVGEKAMFHQGADVYIYDDSLGTWSTKILPPVKEQLAGTRLENRALFGGGCSPLPDYGLLDLDGDGFVGGGELDIIRSFWGQHVAPGDKLHGDISGDGFVGGDDLDLFRSFWGSRIEYFDTVDVYDDLTGLWSTAALSQARYSLAGAAVGGVALFAGGHGEDGYSNVVDMYSLPGDAQQVVPEPTMVGLLFMGALVVLCLPQRCKKSGVERTSGPSILHETVLFIKT